MPVNLRIRAFLYGLFTTIIAAAWIRGLGHALGADAYATDLTSVSTLLAAACGAALGSLLVHTQFKRWWIFFATFGILAVLIVFIIPSFTPELQAIYHQHGPGWKSSLLLFAVTFLLALLPFMCAGIAFARMTAGADAEVMTPLAFGFISAAFLLDIFLGPWLGGILVLLLSGLGIMTVSVGLNKAIPLVDEKPKEAKRALIFSLFLGCVLALAAKSLNLYILQFFPGTRADITWIHIFLVFAFAFGAVGFGKPATISSTPLLWAGFFASLAGSLLAVSLSIINYLAEPAQYLAYFHFFDAKEGSFIQALLLVAAIGGLPALMLGACCRCLSDPISSSGRPSPAMFASILSLGAGIGLLLASFVLLPRFGLLSTLRIPTYGLVILGILCILLLAQGTVKAKLLAAFFCLLVGTIALISIPKQIDIQNPYAGKSFTLSFIVEGPDGIARAVPESAQSFAIRWNHNALTAHQDNLEKLEIALSLLLAEGPDELLLLSPITKKRFEIFRKADISRIDLSPITPLLSELSLILTREESAKPSIKPLRAHAGIYTKYPLILALPEPLWPNSVSGFWTETQLQAIRSRLTDNGCFVFWMYGLDNTSEALRQISRSFAYVFPNTSVLMAFEGFEGPNFCLVGRNQPWPQTDRPPKFFETLEKLKRPDFLPQLPIRNIEDLRGLEIGHREKILETTLYATRNVGPFPPLSWSLKPRFDPKEQIQGIEFFRSLATSSQEPDPTGFVGRGEVKKILLSGFIEHTRHLRNYGIYIPPWEETDLTVSELDRFLEALEIWPDFTPSIQLWEAIGKKLVARNQSALALQYLEKVIQLVPNNAVLEKLLASLKEVDK